MAFNLKRAWSASEVGDLLGSVEDDRAWRLEVTGDGLAQLKDLTVVPDTAYEDSLHCEASTFGTREPRGLALRMDSSDAGMRLSEAC
jgi:hypothetical protein